MATDEKLSPEKDQLRKDQGSTYQKAVDFMAKETASASLEIDDYIVTLACEEAEGMYHLMENGDMHWVIPEPEDNQHVEIIVQDKEDLRFIPGLIIHVRLFDKDGKLNGEKDIPFIWHPFLLHYGINWKIEGEGDYTAEVTIKAPTFCRHDEYLGERYKNDVTVTLGPVHLVPDRSEHGGE
jgi:hypothetical protein